MENNRLVISILIALSRKFVKHEWRILTSNVIQVYDPYRWMEDADSAETQAFVDAHNKITQPYLENCDQWKSINKKLTKLWNYPKSTIPVRHGDYYYYYSNTGLQNQKLVILVAH